MGLWSTCQNHVPGVLGSVGGRAADRVLLTPTFVAEVGGCTHFRPLPYFFVDKDESAEPPWRHVSYGVRQLYLNSSACSWDPKFRQPVIESLGLDLQPGTIGSHFQAHYRSPAER